MLCLYIFWFFFFLIFIVFLTVIMSTTCLIVEVNGIHKQIRINKQEISLNQLKQKIIKRFPNVTFEKQFKIMTTYSNIDCHIDAEDIKHFEDGAKLFLASTTNNNEDNKSQFIDIKEEYDDSDGEQEAQVNQDDLREKAFGCSIQNQNIISCIGRIKATYIKSNNSSESRGGTGTVYKVVDSYAYVITCAHNIRLTEYFQCNQCNQRNHKRICPQCKVPNSTANILKAGKVYFQRRKLENGVGEKEYKCDSEIVYIDDDKYTQYPFAKGGYDIAIIKFKDVDNYYKNICENILLVDGKLFQRVRDKHAYYIFGYPQTVIKNPFTDKYKQREAMWGAESISDVFEYEFNDYNNGQSFLKQREIDASSGTSGAAIFSIYGKYILIFGIHTGGSKTFKYNVGTIMDDKIDYLKIHTAPNSKIKTVKHLINDTLEKIKKEPFYLLLQKRFVYRRAQLRDFSFDEESQIYNIGMIYSDFGGFKRHFIRYRSTGFIIGHSPKYAYVLTTVSAVINKDNKTKAQRMSFQLFKNTLNGMKRCDSVAEYSAESWKIHPTEGNIAVIKINDRNNLLAKVKPLKLRSLNSECKYNEGFVIGYNSPYGRQLFGMKGNIECSDDMKEINYKNIVWRGNGGPIFCCDENKDNDINDIVIDDEVKVSLVKRLLCKGLHIDAIINALMRTDSLKDVDIYDTVCGGVKYKVSKKDQEIYNKKDNHYDDIFGELDNEIIGINAGENGILLNNNMLKWINNTVSCTSEQNDILTNN
eukprot:451720_1